MMDSVLLAEWGQHVTTASFTAIHIGMGGLAYSATQRSDATDAPHSPIQNCTALVPYPSTSKKSG